MLQNCGILSKPDLHNLAVRNGEAVAKNESLGNLKILVPPSLGAILETLAYWLRKKSLQYGNYDIITTSLSVQYSRGPFWYKHHPFTSFNKLNLNCELRLTIFVKLQKLTATLLCKWMGVTINFNAVWVRGYQFGTILNWLGDGLFTWC